MSYEADSVSQGGKIVMVVTVKESEDFFVGVKTGYFADNFHCKYFTVSQLRQRSSGSGWKIIFHKIIIFAEDIYDKIIKIHFLALNGQWNNFCLLTSYLFHRPEGLFAINMYSKTCTRRQ